MAHFAQIDENNVVINITTINNENILDKNGNEDESIGIAFCKNIFGENTSWVQTSYSGKIRKNYAGVGYAYDKIRNAFIPPRIFQSWLLDENTCKWVSPVPYPSDGFTDGKLNEKVYEWDEINLKWVEIFFDKLKITPIIDGNKPTVI